MASHDPQRPNVVFILSDDQGPWAMHCAGNGDMITPEQLPPKLREARPSRFSITSPRSLRCSPARSA